ncbi:hypothetical protein ABZT17_12135 [Streptomyces sp. NPDC005648]|uniref:hypothetical protein n=1 Tax=Streptomyces sp. NPDC005648 TaxID=3157044 RepID=UPI0033BD7E3A
MTARYGRAAAQTDQQVRRMLGEMADRLEANRPDEPITAIGRLALMQATTMDPPLARALRSRVPEITGSLLRREYAVQLRELATGNGQPRTQAERVAVLHAECDQDYTDGLTHQDLNAHRDDAHLIAGASQSAQARADRDL